MPNPTIDKFQIGNTTYDFIDSTARNTADAAVPQTRKVNNKALSADVTLTSDDIGYDSTETYSSGTIGNELTQLSTAITSKTRNINPCAIGQYNLNANHAVAPANAKYAGLDNLVPCSAETTYVSKWYDVSPLGTWYVNYYNSNKEWLSGVNITGAKVSGDWTTPQNCAYVYIYMYNSNGITIGSSAALQIEVGTTPTEFIPYLTAFDAVAREAVESLENETETAIEQLQTNVESEINEIDGKAIQAYQGKNLFNPSDYIANKRLYDTPIGGTQINTDNDSNDIVQVSLKGNTSYSFNAVAKYTLMGSDDTAVAATVTVDSTTENTLTTPINCVSGWFQINHTYESTAMLNEGTSVAKYEPYTKNGYAVAHNTTLVNMKDLPLLSKMDLTSVVTPTMSKSEFVTAFNSAMADYATLCGCFTRSFFQIPTGNLSALSWDFIYETINHNLRKDVALPNVSFEMVCNNINNALTEKIYRFCDARLPNGTARNYSLSTGLQADEPSAIVSEDGGTLYIYAHLKRISTEDGVSWSEPTSLVLSNGGYILHANVNLIDGIYYLIGTNQNNGGDFVLYTSTDGINFTYRGVMLPDGYTLAENYTETDYGNGYLIKEYGSGKWYLYIESQASGTEEWRIDLVTCDDILHANEDGTIGDWEISSHNPVMRRPYASYNQAASTAGNPDFAKGSDNQPLKHDGKYFMYFHSTNQSIANILRAYSYDLEQWTSEGVIFDNRDQPSAGDETSGNADHCVIEFKGRTYLFYTWNINTQAYQPYIKYTVDDRPFYEMLGLRP